MDWQPIETAPMTGEMLVSYLYHGERGRLPDIKYRDKGTFIWPSKFYEVTHWQPLPAPPK